MKRSQQSLSRKVNFCFYYLSAKPKLQLYEIYSGSSFPKRQFESRRKENTTAIGSITKKKGKRTSSPKTNTNSGDVVSHPSPHPECCGRRPPLLSQPHPGVPDSAQEVLPLAHPPSATGKQNKNKNTKREIHVTK